MQVVVHIVLFQNSSARHGQPAIGPYEVFGIIRCCDLSCIYCSKWPPKKQFLVGHFTASIALAFFETRKLDIEFFTASFIEIHRYRQAIDVTNFTFSKLT